MQISHFEDPAVNAEEVKMVQEVEMEMVNVWREMNQLLRPERAWLNADYFIV